ncbi:AI-2E family transporter [Halorussus sp. MSC15.2]|uniref:AI-2E family transporter n=1 Tax=Halorussus sp. MSC15.2 TaxID=2283638 RepID=UPI0013D4B2BD|nr:AI-2E family transporter [Halorussus sp. MSC15.2]NEU58248.1 AI-2E family transporter [Halorussus sp. MSC15.2]
MNLETFLDYDRNRIAWWLYIVALAIGVAFVGYSFVGMFVLGVFFYYASRPIDDRIGEYVDNDGLAAGLTLAGIVTPILFVVGYVILVGLQDLASLSGTPGSGLLAPVLNVGEFTSNQQSLLDTLLENPGKLRSLDTDRVRQLVSTALSALGTVVNVLIVLSLAFGLAFFLLRDDDRIAAWFRDEMAPEGTTGYAYAYAVDDELETVFFGNLVFVLVMAVLAAVVYYGFNFLAPPALTIPFAILLALLTGVASLIPLVVGKVVYVPIVAYLAWVASGQGGVAMIYPIGLLVVSFLVLDILPQTFLQPYISGNDIHVGIMMFAYILGPILFGWYGFFLLPLFFVLVIQAVRIVVTDLIHGDELSPDVDAAPSLGERDLGEMGDSDEDDSATSS